MALKVRFSSTAQKDLMFWKEKQPKKLDRIRELCRDILQDPFAGIGKPEPLQWNLKKHWSRRIDKTHRLVYTVDKKGILVISCRHHY